MRTPVENPHKQLTGLGEKAVALRHGRFAYLRPLIRNTLLFLRENPVKYKLCGKSGPLQMERLTSDTAQH